MNQTFLLPVIVILLLTPIQRAYDESMSACASSPCKNNGQCIDIHAPGGLMEFKCACPSGFKGIICQKMIEPCADDPCENGGVCIPNGEHYRCLCSTDFKGRHCQENADKKKDPCEGDPCGPNGQCVAVNDEFMCECHSGHTGSRCQHGPPATPPEVAPVVIETEMEDDQSGIRILLILVITLIVILVIIMLLLCVHFLRVANRRSELSCLKSIKESQGHKAPPIPSFIEMSNTLCGDFWCMCCKRCGRDYKETKEDVSGVVVPVDVYNDILRKAGQCVNQEGTQDELYNADTLKSKQNSVRFSEKLNIESPSDMKTQLSLISTNDKLLSHPDSVRNTSRQYVENVRYTPQHAVANSYNVHQQSLPNVSVPQSMENFSFAPQHSTATLGNTLHQSIASLGDTQQKSIANLGTTPQQSMANLGNLANLANTPQQSMEHLDTAQSVANVNYVQQQSTANMSVPQQSVTNAQASKQSIATLNNAYQQSMGNLGNIPQPSMTKFSYAPQQSLANMNNVTQSEMNMSNVHVQSMANFNKTPQYSLAYSHSVPQECSTNTGVVQQNVPGLSNAPSSPYNKAFLPCDDQVNQQLQSRFTSAPHLQRMDNHPNSMGHLDSQNAHFLQPEIYSANTTPQLKTARQEYAKMNCVPNGHISCGYHPQTNSFKDNSDQYTNRHDQNCAKRSLENPRWFDNDDNECPTEMANRTHGHRHSERGFEILPDLKKLASQMGFTSNSSDNDHPKQRRRRGFFKVPRHSLNDTLPYEELTRRSQFKGNFGGYRNSSNSFKNFTSTEGEIRKAKHRKNSLSPHVARREDDTNVLSEGVSEPSHSYTDVHEIPHIKSSNIRRSERNEVLCEGDSFTDEDQTIIHGSLGKCLADRPAQPKSSKASELIGMPSRIVRKTVERNNNRDRGEQWHKQERINNGVNVYCNDPENTHKRTQRRGRYLRRSTKAWGNDCTENEESEDSPKMHMQSRLDKNRPSKDTPRGESTPKRREERPLLPKQWSHSENFDKSPVIEDVRKTRRINKERNVSDESASFERHKNRPTVIGDESRKPQRCSRKSLPTQVSPNAVCTKTKKYSENILKPHPSRKPLSKDSLTSIVDMTDDYVKNKRHARSSRWSSAAEFEEEPEGQELVGYEVDQDSSKESLVQTSNAQYEETASNIRSSFSVEKERLDLAPDETAAFENMGDERGRKERERRSNKKKSGDHDENAVDKRKKTQNKAMRTDDIGKINRCRREICSENSRIPRGTLLGFSKRDHKQYLSSKPSSPENRLQISRPLTGNHSLQVDHLPSKHNSIQNSSFNINDNYLLPDAKNSNQNESSSECLESSSDDGIESTTDEERKQTRTHPNKTLTDDSYVSFGRVSGSNVSDRYNFHAGNELGHPFTQRDYTLRHHRVRNTSSISPEGKRMPRSSIKCADSHPQEEANVNQTRVSRKGILKTRMAYTQ